MCTITIQEIAMGFHPYLVPSEGHPIACDPISAEIIVPVRPIIPFIEGMGLGLKYTGDEIG